MPNVNFLPQLGTSGRVTFAPQTGVIASPPAAVSRLRQMAMLASLYGGGSGVAVASPAPAPAPGASWARTVSLGALPKVWLSSAAGGTNLPFTFGQAFGKAHVPANVTLDGATGSQVTVKRRWTDGSSLKHVHCAGRITLPGGFVTTGALSSGATTITFGSGSGTILVGDRVRFGSDLRGTTYAVATVGSGSLTIASPGLLAAVGSGSTMIVERALTFTATTATPTGTALTATDIATAAPTASVQFGSLGTISLAGLLSTPWRTWVSGPEMVECHYRAQLSGTLLVVWFRVRLYAGGRLWVRATVEHGFLDNGAGIGADVTTRIYVPTVTIGGTVVYDNGGAALTHLVNTRWMAEGWIGGSTFAAPRHDTAYIQASLLTPNYGLTTGHVSDAAAAGSPGTGPGGDTTVFPTLNGIAQSYVPLGNANQIAGGQAQGGYQPQIGLLPLWDVLYLTTGGDPRAWNGMLANNKSVNTYENTFRDFTTKEYAKPSDFPTFTGNTSTAPGGGPNQGSTGFGFGWEMNHHGGDGYLSYMLSADYDLYETLLAQALTCYYWCNINHGLGLNRITISAAVRGTAWALRTHGLLAAIAPEGDAIAAEVRTLASNIVNWVKLYTLDVPAGRYPGTSLRYLSNMIFYESQPAEATGAQPWMHDYLLGTMGLLSDVEPGFDQANLVTLRDWLYPSVVGRYGPTGADNFYFGNATPYILYFGTGAYTRGDGQDYSSTWGQAYTATYGHANNETSNAFGNPGAANFSYIGDSFFGLMYAVEHGASGAMAALNRAKGATNWAGASPTVQNPNAPWDDIPQRGLWPRGIAAPW